MFTFKPGKKGCRCIAKIEGGKYDGQKIFLHDLDQRPKNGFKKIFIPDSGRILAVPNINTREINYVAGPSGSGKSTWASKYINLYLKMFPECDFLILSRLNEDKVLDKLNPIRINPEELLDAPIDIHEHMQDGDIVLFDDTDTIQDGDVKKVISKIKNDILETGRHKNIMCVITSHLINGNDRKDCRTILNECHNLTVFPRAGGAYQITYALKNYWGLPKKQIEEILQLPSRWVTISKLAPQYVLHEKGAYLI
jgi:hypothetical protein